MVYNDLDGRAGFRGYVCISLQWFNFTYSHSHASRHGRKSTNSGFHKYRTNGLLRTSRCTWILYLLLINHSGDECNLIRAMAKNGSTRCFFGQKRMYLKTIAAESVVGRT